MKRSWGYGTDQRLRNENQDSYGVFDYPEFTLAVVCDGMGGHVGGAQASCIGVRETHDILLENKDQPVQRALQLAIEGANKAIHDTARKNHRLMGMGTTIAAVVIQDGVAHIAHVGDSRVYMIRDGEVRSLTRDHTMVNLFVEAELLSPEDAATHPEAHVLSRSLGVERTVEVEVSDPVELEPEDTLFICSDGVHGVITDWELGNLDWERPNASIETVMDWVGEREGDDNATAVAVSMNASNEDVPVSELPDPEARLQQLLSPSEGEMTSSGRILPPAVIADDEENEVAYAMEDDEYGDYGDDDYGDADQGSNQAGEDDDYVSYGNQPDVIYYDDEPSSPDETQPTRAEASEEAGPDDSKQWIVDERNPEEVRKAEEERKRKEEEAKKKKEEEAKKGSRGKRIAMLVGGIAVAGLVIGAAGILGYKNMPSTSEGIVRVDGPGQDGVTEPIDPTAEIVISGPEGDQTISSGNGGGSIQVEDEPEEGDLFFEVEPPASPRRLPHRSTYYTAPPPGGPQQFLAVNAARNRDCPASLDVVQEAMGASIDHAQLYKQAWACFNGTHQQPIISARIGKAQRFETILHHFEGTPKRPEEDKAKRLPYWFLPPGGGIEYRLMAYIDAEPAEHNFPEVMRDLMGEPTLTDQLGKDLYLEAMAAVALSEVERPTQEMIQWRARRVYVLAKALESDLARMLSTHRPDLLPILEESLETAATTPLAGFSTPPKPVTEAYEVATGEKPPPKAGRRTYVPAPKPPPEPEPAEPEPFEVKVHKVAPSQRPLDDGRRRQP